MPSNAELFSQEAVVEDIAKIAMKLGDVAMRFAQIERVPRYTSDTRENDAEHSFMLALTASEIASQHFPLLDSGLVTLFSLVHDLVELETSDVATFDIDDTALSQKESAEHDALPAVIEQLPSYCGSLLLRYEAQVEPEARFVRLLDKITPIVVDILGPGNQVMNEDYDVVSSDQLDCAENTLRTRFATMFPEDELAPLHAARKILADYFSFQFAQQV